MVGCSWLKLVASVATRQNHVFTWLIIAFFCLAVIIIYSIHHFCGGVFAYWFTLATLSVFSPSVASNPRKKGTGRGFPLVHALFSKARVKSWRLAALLLGAFFLLK